MATLQSVTFDRDSWARSYATEHLKTDPGIVTVIYLPTQADEREIRFVEVNELIGERRDDALDVIDFGIDFGTETQHRLFVLDVTPSQWVLIHQNGIPLPSGWSLSNAMKFTLNGQKQLNVESLA